MYITFLKIKNIFKRHYFISITIIITAVTASWLTLMTPDLTSIRQTLKNTTKEIKENIALQTKTKAEPKIKTKPKLPVLDGYNIAQTGIVEPKGGTIATGTNIAGIISKVYVTTGNKVQQGDKLFTIDNREAKANYELKNAGYKVAEAEALEAKRQFETIDDIEDKRAISKNEYDDKKNAVKLAKIKKNEARARLEVARIILKKLTVRSLTTGTILKINAKAGEYAAIGKLEQPLMIIGDLSKMHIRIKIDEAKAHKIKAQQKATALLPADPNIKIPLEFVRIEPETTQKAALNTDNTKETAGKVLEVIYSFDNSYNIVVSQRMNVYIKTDNDITNP